MSQRRGEHDSEYAARLAVEALTKSGKRIFVVGYGSLSDPKEFGLALPDRQGPPPAPVKVKGWSRIWTVADALEQPSKARVFVNRVGERFRGYWASFGVAPDPRKSMAATIAEVKPEHLVTLAGREVSYGARIVDNALILDPQTGLPMVGDDCAVLAFVPLRRYQAIYRHSMQLRKLGLPTRQVAVRGGYAEKSLNVAQVGPVSPEWNAPQEIQDLLDPAVQDALGNSAPPIADFEFVEYDPADPQPFERAIHNIRSFSTEHRKQDFALLTVEGREAQRAQDNSLADYLLPIASQLRHHGVPEEHLGEITEAVRGLRAHSPGHTERRVAAVTGGLDL